MSNPEPRPDKKKRADMSNPPALHSFLDFLTQQMTVQPEQITEADPAQLARIGTLVKSVKVD